MFSTSFTTFLDITDEKVLCLISDLIEGKIKRFMFDTLRAPVLASSVNVFFLLVIFHLSLLQSNVHNDTRTFLHEVA